jgi:hypothetical protein
MAKYFTKAQLASYEIVVLDAAPATPCVDCVQYAGENPAEAPPAEWHVVTQDRRVCRWCAESRAQGLWVEERMTDPDDVNEQFRLNLAQPSMRGTGAVSAAEMLGLRER